MPAPRAPEAATPLVTRDGTVLGTPAYMSPEQAAGDIDAMDGRSDVYAIGAMLYHLLAGHAPYLDGGGDPGPHRLWQRIRAGPPRALARAAPAAPQELIAIAERAMATKPAQRYPSMVALADDLRAYMEGRVVAAYEAGAFAELRKWVVRNRALAGALLLCAVTLVAGIVGFAIRSRQAARAAVAAAARESEARSSERRALQVTELVQTALVGSDPNQDGAQGYRVTDAMDAAIREIDGGALAADPLTEAALLQTIARILNGNGRSQDALRLAERALEVHERELPADHPERGRSSNLVAACLQSLGRCDAALPRFRAVLELRRRLGDRHAVADSLNKVGCCLEALGHKAEAVDAFREGLAVLRSVATGDSDARALLIDNLAYALRGLGGAEEALPEHERALAMYQRLHPGGHVRVAGSLNYIGSCLLEMEKRAEALEKFQAALAMRRALFGNEHPVVAESLNNVAACLRAMGQFAAARKCFEEALAIYREVYDGDHPAIATCLNNLGIVLSALRENAAARESAEAAYAMRLRLSDKDHPDTALVLNTLASCAMVAKDHETALAHFTSAAAMYRRLYPGDHAMVAAATNNVGYCLRQLGRLDAALAALQDAFAMRERLYRDKASLDMVVSLTNLATCLLAMGRASEALIYAERLQVMAGRAFPEGHARRKAATDLVQRVQTAVAGK
jgi:tetratricopeptide (TPR) repeat protein